MTIELKDNDVYVDPTELEFPAEGGTKDVKVNFGAYKYFGYKIEDKDLSWISAENKNDNGVYVRFTVKPNTTAEKRETTVYCFVSNAENATDDQKVFMPVKIIQKASSQIVGVSIFASFGTFIDHIEQYMGRFGGNWSNDNNNTQISVKKDGGLHVTCSNGADGLSFEIDDLNKLKSKTAKISNINGEGNGYGGWGISAEGSSENTYVEDDRSVTCMWDIGNVYSFHSYFQEPSIIDYKVVGYITITLSK